VRTKEACKAAIEVGLTHPGYNRIGVMLVRGFSLAGEDPVPQGGRVDFGYHRLPDWYPPALKRPKVDSVPITLQRTRSI
jgi:hypothetical protein